MPTVEDIERVVKPVLIENRFELIETHYRKEAGRWVLRLFIDKLPETGESLGFRGSKVTLEDCEIVSAFVGDTLDASDLIGMSYVLEVSSPGINRPLKNEAHFRTAMGQNVKISLYAPLFENSNQKNFGGILAAAGHGTVELIDDTSGKVTIPIEKIAKARLDLI